MSEIKVGSQVSVTSLEKTRRRFGIGDGMRSMLDSENTYEVLEVGEDESGMLVEFKLKFSNSINYYFDPSEVELVDDIGIPVDFQFIQESDTIIVVNAAKALSHYKDQTQVENGQEFEVYVVDKDAQEIGVEINSRMIWLSAEGIVMPHDEEVLEDSEDEDEVLEVGGIPEDVLDAIEKAGTTTLNYVMSSDIENYEVGMSIRIVDAEDANLDDDTELMLSMIEDGRVVSIDEVDSDDDSVSFMIDDGGEHREVWAYITGIEFLDSELVEDAPTEDVTESQPAVAVTKPSFVITGDSVTLVVNGESQVINYDQENFVGVRDAVLAGDFDTALALISPAAGIKNWGKGALVIDNGQVMYNGMTLTGKLVDKVIGMMGEGDKAFERFAKFLNLVMEQSSMKTRERLMEFAAHDKLDLSEAGYVIAFKNVRANFMDKHSGRFDNHVGETPSVARHLVNDDHNIACAAGLHVCSPTYLKGFWGVSGATVKVEVDPRDFVAIPYDYQDSKARVCRYSVVEDVTDRIKDYL